MLTILLLFLAFSAISVLCCALTRKSYGETLPLSILSILCALYWFGIFGCLRVGVYVICGLLAACYPAALVVALRRDGVGAWLRRVVTPAFAVYALLCAMVYVTTRGMLVHYTDEFTHWADVVKVMCQLDAFATHPESYSWFSTYPPAMAVLQYFAQGLHQLVTGSAAFQEPLLYVTYQWALLSLLIPFCKGLSFKRPLGLLAAASFVLLTPMLFFFDALDSLYIDPFLGALGGFVFAYAFHMDRDDPLDAATVCVALFALVLAKDAGLLFALGGLGAYLAMLFVGDTTRRTRLEEAAGSGGVRMARQSWLHIGFAVAGVLAVGLAKLSWMANVAAQHAELGRTVLSQPIELGELLAVFTGTTQLPWRRTVLSNYAYRLLNPLYKLQPTTAYLSYFAVFGLLTLGFYLLWCRYKKEALVWRRRFRWLMGIVLGTTAAYVAGLVVVYMFKFTQKEALDLAAVARYWHIICTMDIVALAACCWLPNGVKPRSSQCNALLLAALLLLSPWQSLLDAFSMTNVADAQDKQAELIAYTDEIKAKLPDDGQRIYLLAQGETYTWFWNARYRMRPQLVVNDSWSTGFYADDSVNEEAAPIGLEELSKSLFSSYDYLALYKVDEGFKERCAPLFEAPEAIQEGHLYQVDRESGKLRDLG
ncbi:MAG: hypothetical protein RR301_05870 [Clostridia bacterium]